MLDTGHRPLRTHVSGSNMVGKSRGVVDPIVQVPKVGGGEERESSN